MFAHIPANLFNTNDTITYKITSGFTTGTHIECYLILLKVSVSWMGWIIWKTTVLWTNNFPLCELLICEDAGTARLYMALGVRQWLNPKTFNTLFTLGMQICTRNSIQITILNYKKTKTLVHVHKLYFSSLEATRKTATLI